jgi:hypothetical protein
VALEDGPPDPLQRKANFKLFFEIDEGDAAPEVLTWKAHPMQSCFSMLISTRGVRGFVRRILIIGYHC